MVFSSHLFLFYFLTGSLVLYYLSPRWLKHLTLAAVSYVFYGWTNPLFVVLMFVSTLIDYLCGLAMAGQLRPSTWRVPILLVSPGQPRTKRQRWVLTISMISNLSLLGFFKYFNFLTFNYTALTESLGLTGMGFDNVLRLTLPLGISFYTFQSMSYTIDVYRGDARAIRNPIDYWCYVAMFPQLVAGPIVRFRDVADQLRERTHTIEKFSRGVAFLGLGLGKKILLANPCGKVADMAFDAGSIGCIDSWVGAVAYAFQIYFDFSAYSDMAIGLGLMMGFWQFAARELAVGDWKLLDMTLKQSRQPADDPPPGSKLIVSGTIAAKSVAPRAGQMPYAHHIFTLDLTDLQVHRGTLTAPKIAVYLFSMRNQQNTPAFSWPVGKQVKLKLQSWRPEFFRKYGRINRTETDDIELECPWWGEVIE